MLRAQPYLAGGFFILYFSIFILYSLESELYRYILDGTSVWELTTCHLRYVWATGLPHKGGGVPLSALPKDATSELHNLP